VFVVLGFDQQVETVAADAMGLRGRAPKITDDLLGASKRIGINLDDLTISNGVGRLRVTFAEGIKHGDIGKIVDFARASGAKKVILDTGQIVNPSITRRIESAITAGKPFLGGTPRLVRELPNIIPNSPPVKIFEITF